MASVLHTAQLPVLERGFFEMGLDSLMAVELASRLSKGLGVAVPSSALFNYPTIRELAEHLHGALFISIESAPEVGQAGPNGAVAEQMETIMTADRLAYLQQLSEQELEAFIDQKLTPI